MLHYVRYKINKDDSGLMEAVIFCPTTMIETQCKEKLSLFDCAGRVMVTSNWQPKKWLENPKNTLFVIDEGEDCIEKRLLELTPQGFTGLVALKDARTALFTATLTDYFAGCWKRALRAPEQAIKRFESQQEVRNNVSFRQDVKVSLRETREEALADFLNEIKERCERQPLLVFIAEDDTVALAALQDMMKKVA